MWCGTVLGARPPTYRMRRSRFRGDGQPTSPPFFGLVCPLPLWPPDHPWTQQATDDTKVGIGARELRMFVRAQLNLAATMGHIVLY